MSLSPEDQRLCLGSYAAAICDLMVVRIRPSEHEMDVHEQRHKVFEELSMRRIVKQKVSEFERKRLFSTNK
jgi:hypothetical protein